MKTMEERIQEFVNQIVKNEVTDIEIVVEGWRQSSEYTGGINPFCDDVVICGKIIKSNEPSLIGKIVEREYHGSYSGVWTAWKFLDTMEKCPKNDEFVPSTKLRDAGTQYSWKEGKFSTTLDNVKYEDMPDLDVWEIRRRELKSQVELAVKTRRKPGIKFGFINWGYQRNEEFSPWARIPGEVERNCYQSGCKAVVATFNSWGRNVDYIEVERLA